MKKMTHDQQKDPGSPSSSSWVWKVENFEPLNSNVPSEGCTTFDNGADDGLPVAWKSTVRAPVALGLIILSSIVGLIITIVASIFLDFSLVRFFLVLIGAQFGTMIVLITLYFLRFEL